MAGAQQPDGRRGLGDLGTTRRRRGADRLHRHRWRAPGRRHEVSRRVVSRGGPPPPTKENAMETTTQELTTRGFEQSTIQTDHTPVGAAERVIGDLTEWSIGAAKESARLVAELQMAVFDALHESHGAALTTWPVALADPLRLYQRAFMETIDSTQRALTF